MEELRQRLQDKLDWIKSTRGAKHVSVKLDASQLARIMSALRECENPDLPKIESHMLGFMEPRGTKRSPEEVANMLTELYGQKEDLHEKLLHICAQFDSMDSVASALPKQTKEREYEQDR